MFDNVPAVVPPTVLAAEAALPAPELPPPGESSLPAPTTEQTQVADRVFTGPEQPQAAASLLGALTCAMMLRDVAVDSLDTTDEEDESKKKSKDADSDD